MVGTTIALHDVIVHHHYYNNTTTDMEPSSENNALFRTLRYHYLFKIYMPVYRWLHTENTGDEGNGNVNKNSARLLSTEDYMMRKRAYRKAYSVAGLPSAEKQQMGQPEQRRPSCTQSNLNISTQHQSIAYGRFPSPRLSPSRVRKLRSYEKLRNYKTLSIPEEPEVDMPSLPYKVVSQDSGYNGSCMGLADPCGHCDQCTKGVFSDGEALLSRKTIPRKRDLVRRHRSCPEKRTSISKVFDSTEFQSLNKTKENPDCQSPDHVVVGDKHNGDNEVFVSSDRQNSDINILQPKVVLDKKIHNSDSACSGDTELSDATVIEKNSWINTNTEAAVLNIGTDTTESMSLPSNSSNNQSLVHNGCRSVVTASDALVRKLDSIVLGSKTVVSNSNTMVTGSGKPDSCVSALKSVVNMCCDLCSCPGGLETCGDISSWEDAVSGGDMNANVTGYYNCSKCNGVKNVTDQNSCNFNGYDVNICKPKVPGSYKQVNQKQIIKPTHSSRKTDSFHSVDHSESAAFQGKTQVHLSNKIKYMKLQTCVSFDKNTEVTKTQLSDKRSTGMYSDNTRMQFDRPDYYRSNSAKLLYMQQLEKAYKIGASQSEEFLKSTKVSIPNANRGVYKRHLHKVNGVVQTSAGAYSHRRHNRKLQQSQSFSARHYQTSAGESKLKSKRYLSSSLDEVHCSSQKDSVSCKGGVNNPVHCKCKSTSSILQSRKNERQEILRKLAMGGEEESGFGSQDRALKKTNIQSRYQGGQSLQLCFMNDPQQADGKAAVPEPSTTETSVPSMGPASVPGIVTEEIVTAGESKEDKNLIVQQQKLQHEATIALAQVPSMAKMQLQIEKKVKKKSPIAEITGIHCLGDGKILQLTLPVLQDMNFAQLQVVVNDLHSQIESLNMDLVNYLIERDDLHMEQDSMLVDIEDLHMRAEELADRVQIAPETPKKSKKDRKK